ncbi:unnamed protein product [Orchesella dallaii]|uniref:Uncharacterized protein n=1 Tax=Orchesella dallaii TaxID=48710 RepID=A0ABP1RFW8_9HEXA
MHRFLHISLGLMRIALFLFKESSPTSICNETPNQVNGNFANVECVNKSHFLFAALHCKFSYFLLFEFILYLPLLFEAYGLAILYIYRPNYSGRTLTCIFVNFNNADQLMSRLDKASQQSCSC